MAVNVTGRRGCGVEPPRQGPRLRQSPRRANKLGVSCLPAKGEPSSGALLVSPTSTVSTAATPSSNLTVSPRGRCQSPRRQERSNGRSEELVSVFNKALAAATAEPPPSARRRGGAPAVSSAAPPALRAPRSQSPPPIRGAWEVQTSTQHAAAPAVESPTELAAASAMPARRKEMLLPPRGNRDVPASATAEAQAYTREHSEPPMTRAATDIGPFRERPLSDLVSRCVTTEDLVAGTPEAQTSAPTAASTALRIKLQPTPQGCEATATVTVAVPNFSQRVAHSLFTSKLRQRRGSLLRAWRVDIDSQGLGRVSRTGFSRACRSLGLLKEGNALWASLRPDGNSAALKFVEFATEEALNASMLEEVLRAQYGFDLDQAWRTIDTARRGYVGLTEFVRATRSMGYDGNAVLLFRGLDTEGLGRLTRGDFDFMHMFSKFGHETRHCPDTVREFACFVEKEFGGADCLIENIRLMSSTTVTTPQQEQTKRSLLNSPNGGFIVGATTSNGPHETDPTFTVPHFAELLMAIGFRGNATEIANLAARSSRGIVSVESVLAMLPVHYRASQKISSLPGSAQATPRPGTAQETPRLQCPPRYEWNSTQGSTDERSAPSHLEGVKMESPREQQVKMSWERPKVKASSQKQAAEMHTRKRVLPGES